MGLNLLSASTQYLLSTAVPLNAAPFTIGVWFWPRTLPAAQDLFAITTAPAVSDYWELQVTSAGEVKLFCKFESGAEDECATTTGVVTTAAWHFLMMRAISATNRRIHVLKPSGGIVSANTTTSVTPKAISIDRMSIGAFTGGEVPANGVLAEFWWTNTDIQLGGLDIQDALMRQIAYSGPFSVPEITANLIEYRSFRKNPLGGDGDDVYFGKLPRQAWVPFGSPMVGIHPPLPYYYKSLKDISRTVLV